MIQNPQYAQEKEMTVTMSDNGDLVWSLIFEVPQRAWNSLHTVLN